MNRDDQQLDVLLGRLREIPPAISPDATRDFLLSHLREHGQPYIPKSRFIPRPIILTGGVMAVLTICILLLSSMFGPTTSNDDQSASRNSPDKPEVTQVPMGEPAGNSLKDVPLPTKALPPTHAAEAQVKASDATQSENIKSTAVLDSLKRRYMHESFASWTKERIEGYAVYEFDSSTLSKIGLTIDDDGSIIEEQGGLRIGMREMPEDGSVMYTFMGIRPATPQDSLKLSTPRPKGHIQMQQTDSTVDEPEWCECNAVLITNSNGRTYGHTYNSGQRDDPDAIGSGKFKNWELVPVRLAGPGDLQPKDGSEFFYLYWYEPTDRFLAALPPDIRSSIVHRLNMLRSRSLLPPTALVETSVHPNPATSDMVTVDYTLMEDRRVALTVYDITGGRLRDVAVSDTRASGTWQENVSFEGIPNGYYLLAVTTDRGEQRIQPFILKR